MAYKPPFVIYFTSDRMGPATVASLRERLPKLVEEQIEQEARLRANLNHPKLGPTGTATSMLAGHLRFLAVAAFVLNRDVPRFKRLMRESAELRLSLIERFDAGEPVSPSYVLIVYKELFGALAAGDIALAERFAARMGGRPDTEKKYDNPSRARSATPLSGS